MIVIFAVSTLELNTEGPVSRVLTSWKFHGSIADDAIFAHNICRRCSSYLNIFPMWHKNHERAELLENGTVRFEMPHDSPRQRQVIAYQQLFRPAEEARRKTNPTPHSPYRQKLFSKLFDETRARGLSRRFRYVPKTALIEELRPDYVMRLDENFRHPDDFQLNGYSLREFKEFYIALLILCSMYAAFALKKPLSEYARVHYLLLIRDYWHWINDEDSIALVDFDEFRLQYAQSSDLRRLLGELLQYGWLPVEDEDFYVRYKTQPVNGSMIESLEFMSGKKPIGQV